MDSQKIHVSTYPPLGQVTQLENGIVAIHALLQVPRDRQKEPWQLALWHSDGKDDARDWVETEFTAIQDQDQVPSTLQVESESWAKLHFVAKVRFEGSLRFTVKTTSDSSGLHWKWVRDEQNLGDGVVVPDSTILKKTVSQPDLPHLIEHFNSELKWREVVSQSPRTRLWSIEAPVEASRHDESAVADIPLGHAWGGSKIKWFSLVRTWTPWLAPRHGGQVFRLDENAILCAFLSCQGEHMVFLGISLNHVTTLLRSDDHGRVSLHLRNDGLLASTGTVLVAVGHDFASANAAVAYQARDLLTSKWTGEHDAEMAALGDAVKPEWYENWYDGLGYCTWNALGQQLTDEKVVRAVDSLAEHKIRITSLIIDDNWQDIDYHGDGQFQYGWKDFEAEPKAFPRGLGATVQEIRKKHKNIQHVAVWHALLGYWGGISRSGSLAKKYKTVEVAREDSLRPGFPLGGNMAVIAEEDVHRFYDDFYSFLSSCGVDAVKTDAQFMLDTLVSAKARRDLTHKYLDAWTINSLRHFSIKAISCMSQTPQIIFYSQMPPNRPAVPCRNSDDFIPEDAASHAWHVWTNAHNSLFTQHLNVLPDWDMFQTVHDYSAFHAASRCISGGPIYITDVPGQHDVHLIGQMTGTTPRGKTVIFRPSVLGRSLDQYVGYEDKSLLKVAAYHGHAATGTSILGVFNVSAGHLTDMIPLSRFLGVLPSETFVVRAHSSGRVSKPLQTSSPASLLTVSLDVRGFEILTAFPLALCRTKTGGSVHVANLGLLGKMTGCAAVLDTKCGLRNGNGKMLVDTTLKALGVLGLYISNLPELSVQEDFMVTLLGQPIPGHTVRKSTTDEHVLEVHVEMAWTEMGLSSGHANEVQVKVYFTIDK